MQAPSPMIVYTGITGDYYLQSLVFSSIFYISSRLPYYGDKWVGNPVLRSTTDFEYILHKHARVWLVSAPHGLSMARLEQKSLDIIAQKMTLITESTNGKLYLWENPAFWEVK